MRAVDRLRETGRRLVASVSSRRDGATPNAMRSIAWRVEPSRHARARVAADTPGTVRAHATRAERTGMCAHRLNAGACPRGFAVRAGFARPRTDAAAAAARAASSRVGTLASRRSAGLAGDAASSAALAWAAAARVRGIAASRGRGLATKTRDYFGRDDVREGDAVAYTKKGVQKLAIVASPPRRRLLDVLDASGARDRVELKHVENVFAVVVPEMGVDSRKGENVRVDLSANGGGRSFGKKFGVALAAATAFAEARVAFDERNENVTLRDAWMRARERGNEATGATVDDDAHIATAQSLASSAFAFAFDDDDDDARLGATPNKRIRSSLDREFAAHALLSSRAGARFFQPSSKGRFAPRAPQDVAAMGTRADEQDAADAARAAEWQRVRDAVSAPPGSKPDPGAFAEATRGAGAGGDASVARALESLEAYALGRGRYTAGQAACAKDALGRLGMRVSERSARDALTAVGRWRGLEDASWRRWDVETRHDPALEAYAAALADGSVDAPEDADAAARKDLTRLTTYAIDAADSEEIDDAVSAERTRDGKTRVWIHVADASRWSPVHVRRGDDATRDDDAFVMRGDAKNVAPAIERLRVAMDAAARRRGASAYGPEGAIPMFPAAFAFKKGPTSLALGETRCAMSVTAVLADDGEVDEYWIGPTTVRVTHAVTEHEAAAMLERDAARREKGAKEESEESGERGEHSHSGLASLLEAATRRASLRERRGAVTIELPESVCVVRRVEVDEVDAVDETDAEILDAGAALARGEDGDDGDQRLAERDAHVLAAGGRNAGERAAAAARRHEAARLDVSLSIAAKAPSAHSIVSEMMILAGELVGKFGAANGLPLPYRGQADPVSVNVSGVPEGIPRDIARRGGMRGASVGATPRRHGGLGVDAYVQFTSPIRRYLDLVAHAQVKAFLRKDATDSTTPGASRLPFPDAASMETVVRSVGERARDAKSATRDATAFWQTFWFATKGRDIEHEAIVARWIRRDQRLATAFFTETGLERGVKLADVEKELGTRASLGDVVFLRVRDADPFEDRLAFDAARIVKRR